jgi:signal transduction histidine kinase
MTLKTKVSVALVGTLVLAVLGSVTALVSAWRSRDIMETTIIESLADARAVAQLEISLLEQRGFVSSYVLDGKREWLVELEKRQPAFASWLARVRKMPRTADERRVVTRLDEVFGQYDKGRDEVVALYDRGDQEAARILFLTKVNPLYNKAYQLCEELVSATGDRNKATVAEGRRDIRRVSILVLVCVILTVALGGSLLWVFFRGILLPLRRMAEEAQVFSGPETVLARPSSPRDELYAVGLHLRALMSDVEQARGRLLNAEKLASVGKLAACVAHEIRNPLTSLKMRLFSVARELGGDPLYEDDLRVMSDEIVRLEGVIRNFLEFARPPELNVQRTSITLILDKTLELVRHRLVEKDIKLQRKGEPGLPDVKADPQQMKQVFINLLINAIEAMGEGGTMRLAGVVQPDDETGAMVVVRVRDTGGGIPEEARERIFEPFFTLKEESTGLGLCIAARIMARHGGRLELESSTPAGSVFAVWVPTAAPEGDHEHDPRG